MKFRTGELEFNATVADSSEAPSLQTGDTLRSLTIQFRAQKEAMHEQALEEAQQRQSGGLFSLGDTDQPEMEWRVRDSSSSYVGSQPWGINHHVWRIEQVERLACERLILASSVHLEPYEYVEDVSDLGTLRLAARALISQTDLDMISRLSGPIDVVRVGISEQPRTMMLRYLWGSRPEASAIVVQCEDAREPRLTRNGWEAASSADEVSGLMDLLRASGVLSADDLEQARQQRHAARRVSNVDGWEL